MKILKGHDDNSESYDQSSSQQQHQNGSHRPNYRNHTHTLLPYTQIAMGILIAKKQDSYVHKRFKLLYMELDEYQGKQLFLKRDRGNIMRMSSNELKSKNEVYERRELITKDSVVYYQKKRNCVCLSEENVYVIDPKQNCK